MEAIELIRKIGLIRKPGPIPLFSDFHVWKTIRLIASKGPIGRHSLRKKLKLGEGSTRRLMDRLKEEGVIDVSRSGCVLTSRGKGVWKELSTRIGKIARVDASSLTVGKIDIAIQVKNAGHKVSTGIRQRDAAIKVGADGATTLAYTKGKLVVPILRKHLDEESKLAKQIRSLFALEENDMVVIGTSDSDDKAEMGAWAAARTLI